MMRILVLVLGLAACDRPGTYFETRTATRVTVQESTFDVRTHGRLAEALRVNPEYAPRFGPIRDRAAIAMALVSGCRVTEVLGDAALATGILDCGDGAEPPRLPPVYDCAEIDSLTTRAGRTYRDFDCTPL